MNARGHIRKAQQLLGEIENASPDADHADLALLAQIAGVHAQIAVALVVGADIDPVQQLRDDAVRAPVLRLPIREDTPAPADATARADLTSPTT